MATDALAAFVAALLANGTPAPAGDALALAAGDQYVVTIVAELI